MDLQPWIERLEGLGLVRSIEGTAELATARRDYQRPPAQWVMPLAEQAQPGRGMPIRQRVTARIAVVTCVRNFRDAHGRAGLKELQPVRDGTIAGLLGWHPDPEGGPVTYAGGKLVDLRDRVIWWRDEFNADFWLREEP